jgi:two-component system response regulator AtoC
MKSTLQAVRMLAVSRDLSALRPLWSIAEQNGWELETAPSAWEALERVQSGAAPDLLVLDMPHGERDSLHVLRWLRRLRPEVPMLLLCDQEGADKRKDALRIGAAEVLVRPFTQKKLDAALEQCIAGSSDGKSADRPGEYITALGDDRFLFIGSSPMQKVRDQVELLSQADVPVLIVGEKGSGKITIARLIHQLSVRSGFKFRKVNCAASSGVALEQEIFGNGSTDRQGTIVIEEITELPLPLQGRLLDLLPQASDSNSGTVCGVRILATTSANLDHVLAEKALREDLYYRLSAYTVHVPSLRQRNGELRFLLHQFMHSLSKHYGLPPREFTPQVIEACEKYSWPGNVEELEAFVKRYLVAGESKIVLRELNPESHANKPLSGGANDGTDQAHAEALDRSDGESHSLKALIHSIKSETEKNAISLALEKTGWNRKAAARLLQMSYRNLLYKIEQYRLHSSDSVLSPLSRGELTMVGMKGKVS